MTRYSLSGPARVDLRGIRDWIKKDTPTRAVNFVEALIARYSILAEHPMMGRSRPELGEGPRAW